MQVDVIATCRLCGKPITTATDCYRAAVDGPERIHVLCLAAFMLMGESPSRLDYEVVDDINGAAEDLCAEWCENPAHGQA